MCPQPSQCIRDTGPYSLGVTPASPTAMDIYALGSSSALGTLAHTLYMSYWPARLLRSNVPSAHPVHSEHWPTLSICHTGRPDCYGQMCPRPIQCIRNTGQHSLYVTPASPTAMDIYALGSFSAFRTLAHTLSVSHTPADCYRQMCPRPIQYMQNIYSQHYGPLSVTTHQLT
jgi:hypothetical protein